jgi:chemotaxis signal transduction protein
VSPPETVAARTGELRARFDASFAAPPPAAARDADELLALGAAGHPYAIRLRQTAGLYADRHVVALPGPVAALLGVAGFSGTTVPVYDLGALLGHPADPGPAPRWLLLAGGTPPLALAFTELHGHLRIPAGGIVADPDGRGEAGCVRGMVVLPDGTRPIVDLPAVRAAVRALTRPTQAPGSGEADG